MKIYFNGQMINMDKENLMMDDYKKGVKYIYKYVPNKLGSNFYYFEASNGKGARVLQLLTLLIMGPFFLKADLIKMKLLLLTQKPARK